MTLDPRTQEVSFKIGSIAVIIPSGSFVLQRGVYKFSGLVSGVQVSMEIGAVKGGGYKFVIQADALDLTGTANPIDFEMRLGDQYGLASSKLLGTLSVDSGKQ